MPGSAFDIIFNWLIGNGYYLMFLAMLFEGPMVNAAAAFAASLGHFDVRIVFLIAFWGDFLGDLLHYGVGYVGRSYAVEKFGRLLGISPERGQRLEEFLTRNATRALIITKLIPIIPPLILVIAGAIRMPLKKFAGIVAVIIIPRIIVFTALGFYFGKAFTSIARYMNNAQVALIFIFGIAFIVFYAYRRLSYLYFSKLDKLE